MANDLGGASCQGLQVFGETIQALRPTRLHAFEHCDGPRGQTDSAPLQREFRLTAVLGERHRGKPVDERIALFVHRCETTRLGLISQLSLVAFDRYMFEGYPARSQLIIQGVPNWSASIPNRTAQKVSWIGIRTIPFSASA